MSMRRGRGVLDLLVLFTTCLWEDLLLGFGDEMDL